MDANAGQFRGVLLGGFHRQDVLDYLEQQAQEHRQEVEALKAEQEKSIREALAGRDLMLASLQAQVDDLTPKAEAWQKIRESAGDIVVTAHAQARNIVEGAARQAAQTEAEGARRVMAVQEEFDALQETLHKTILAAEREMEGAREAFRRAEEKLLGLHNALAELAGQAEKPEKTAGESPSSQENGAQSEESTET